MGWPRKNEGARLYRVAKNDYRLVFEVPEDPATDNRHAGTFTGLCPTVTRYDLDRWSVKRDGNGLVRIQYEGVTQQTMGSWSTLALPEGSFNALDATDTQVLQAYLGDENIFTGDATRPVDRGMQMVRLPTPVTWGGTATRIQWSDLSDTWQDLLAAYLDCAPAIYRGLWRMGDQPSTDKQQTSMEV